MAHNSEIGHAKNLANFEKLISFCIGLGNVYKPAKNAHQIAAMQAKFETAKSAHDAANSTKTILDNSYNSRRIFFDQLPGLSSRIIYALDSTDASPDVVNDAKRWKRKIRGQRSTPKPKKTDPAATVPATISDSQRSYDKLIEHLSKLTDVLRMEPNYQINEPDLSIAGLDQTIATGTALNSAVINSKTEWNMKQLNRNKELYDKKTGLVTDGNDVKLYLKSIFGLNSPEYKIIRTFEFKYLNSK